MGTNYYLHKNPCDKCGRSYEEDLLHIGKSSAGWCFSLHVIPESKIHTLDDWKREFLTGKIFNEYDEEISVEQMLSTITERSWSGQHNHEGAPGPNGLARHTPMDASRRTGCVGYGDGTWDYVAGEFS